MKKNYLLGIVLFFSIHLSFSQFIDDMEWEKGNCSSNWYGDCPIITKVFSYNGNQSGFIGGNGVTNNLLDLGNRTEGQWGLEFYMYVPKGKEGYFNIQGEVPVSAGESVVGNFYFNKDNTNPGVGVIDDTALGDVNFNFPHDYWFRIIMNFDLIGGTSNGTWQLHIDGIEIIPEVTPFTNEVGDIPTSLGGINFNSISSNTEFYFDGFKFEDSFIIVVVQGKEDFYKDEFTIYPNPTQNKLFVESVEEILKIKVYSQLGQLVMQRKFSDEIDVFPLAKGLYFIEVETNNGKGIQKFIKN